MAPREPIEAVEAPDPVEPLDPVDESQPSRELIPGAQQDILPPDSGERIDEAFLGRLRAWLDSEENDHAALPPAAALDVMHLVDDPHRSVQELAAAVSRDPALAGAVLKLANSALHRGTREVCRIQDAIVRLGQRSLRMLLMNAVFGQGQIRSRPYRGIATAAWKHSLATALLARDLAKPAELDPDLSYMSGLFHDIGVLATLDAARRLARRDEDRPGAATVVEAVQRHAYSMNPRMICGWELPDPVRRAVVEYRTWPSRLHEGDESLRYAVLVSVANDAMKHFGLWVPARPVDASTITAAEQLGLEPEQYLARDRLTGIAESVERTTQALAIL